MIFPRFSRVITGVSFILASIKVLNLSFCSSDKFLKASTSSFLPSLLLFLRKSGGRKRNRRREGDDSIVERKRFHFRRDNSLSATAAAYYAANLSPHDCCHWMRTMISCCLHHHLRTMTFCYHYPTTIFLMKKTMMIS